MQYKFIAEDAEGKDRSGTVEAGSEAEVSQALQAQGYRPISIVPLASPVATKPVKKKKLPKKKARAEKKNKAAKAGKKKDGGGKGLQREIALPSFLSAKVKQKELVSFTRQLATLLDAGLPLVRGLDVLGRQEKNPTMRKILNESGEAIRSGSTFADALSAHPKAFDRLYVNMARAGELGGVLDKVLLRMAEYMEKVQRIKNKVKGAMIYPAVVLTMALGILLFLVTFIIPKFEKIFEDILQGAPLPALTQFVLKLSELIRHNALLIIGIVVVLTLGVKLFGKLPFGRRLIDKLKWYMPPFGVLTVKSNIARFARTLSTLMDSGVPLLQGLTIVRETTANTVMSDAIQDVHDSVKEGETMAAPMEAAKIFPPMVVGMVEVGEETGELSAMLGKVADGYDDEVDNAVAGLTSVIEPILIVLLAVMVGTIVIALFLPLISIISNLS